MHHRGHPRDGMVPDRLRRNSKTRARTKAEAKDQTLVRGNFPRPVRFAPLPGILMVLAVVVANVAVAVVAVVAVVAIAPIIAIASWPVAEAGAATPAPVVAPSSLTHDAQTPLYQTVSVYHPRRISETVSQSAQHKDALTHKVNAHPQSQHHQLQTGGHDYQAVTPFSSLPVTSISVGTVNQGYLVGGVSLPVLGNNHRVGSRQESFGFNWAAAELIAAILRSAEAVAASHTDAILFVGNLSRLTGGNIPHSVSHASGRDVDLGFYLVDGEGRFYFPDDYLPIDKGGFTTEQTYSFHSPSNWILVKSLIENPTVEVQYIFVARHISKLILDRARAERAPADLIQRAARLMVQPATSPHDDHFHIRIACPLIHVGEGCIDTGSGLSSTHRAQAERIIAEKRQQIRRLLASPDPRTRQEAVFMARLLRDHKAIVIVLPMLSDPEPHVRYQVARLLADVPAIIATGEDQALRAADQLIASMQVEPDPVVLHRMIDTALQLYQGAALKPSYSQLKWEQWANKASLTLITLLKDRRCTPPQAVPDFDGPFLSSACTPHGKKPGVELSGRGSNGEDAGAASSEDGESPVLWGMRDGLCAATQVCHLPNHPAPEDREQAHPAPAEELPPLQCASWCSGENVGPRPFLVMELAASALAALGRLEAIEPLASLLSDQGATPAHHTIHYALTILLNRDLGEEAEPWLRWASNHRDATRRQVLEDGFIAAGYCIGTGKSGNPFGDGAAHALVQAVGEGSPFISYNAQVVLMKVFRRTVPSLVWPRRDAHRYWQIQVGKSPISKYQPPICQ